MKTPINHDFLIELGYIHHKGIVAMFDGYRFDTSVFESEEKCISIIIDPGNQMIYVRDHEKGTSHTEDMLVSIYNSDVSGPLTCEYVEQLTKLLTPKRTFKDVRE